MPLALLVVAAALLQAADPDASTAELQIRLGDGSTTKISANTSHGVLGVAAVVQRFCSTHGVGTNDCDTLHVATADRLEQLAMPSANTYCAVFSPTTHETVDLATASRDGLRVDFAAMGRKDAVSRICLWLDVPHAEEKRRCYAADTIRAALPVQKLPGQGSLQLHCSLVDKAGATLHESIVPFELSNRDVTVSTDAQFFLAGTSTASGDAAPHASSERVFALLRVRPRSGTTDGESMHTSFELMFRSSGTSNPGANFPGFFFPVAGVCPFVFLDLARAGRRDLSSFRRGLGLSTQDASLLRTQLRQGPYMFDKRFDVQYEHREREDESWHSTTVPRIEQIVRRHLRKNSVNISNVGVDVRARNPATIPGLRRFSTLAQASASVRLGLPAWRAAGPAYAAAASVILGMAKERGLESAVLPKDAVPVRGRVRIKKRGLCAVNDYIDRELGWRVLGWSEARQDAGCTASADLHSS